MELSKKTIVIGGLPQPVGGVTTFLSRLSKVYPNMIIRFIDLYPNLKKEVPTQIEKKYKLISNKLLLINEIVCLQSKYSDIELFYNFSTTKSLIIFIALPKFKNQWSLMLHHGDLTSHLPTILLKYILSKFDNVYALSDRQEDFYNRIDPSLNIIKETSYVPAILNEISNKEKKPLIKAKASAQKIIIGSGFPRALYQHDLLIDIINNNKDTYLFLFLYGDGELKSYFKNLKHNRVNVFFDKKEDIFNYYLSESDLYIRPTLEDSFGIACADAVQFGVPVIASNVCKRYQGTITYNIHSNHELFSQVEEVLEK